MKTQPMPIWYGLILARSNAPIREHLTMHGVEVPDHLDLNDRRDLNRAILQNVKAACRALYGSDRVASVTMTDHHRKFRFTGLYQDESRQIILFASTVEGRSIVPPSADHIANYDGSWEFGVTIELPSSISGDLQ